MMTPKNLALAVFLLALPALAFGQGFDPAAIFGGPSVLGRALGAGVAGPGQTASFRPFASVRGVYDDAFTDVVLDDSGNATSQALRGFLVSGGAYGAKRFKRSAISVSAAGGYIDYRRTRDFSGWNARGVLGYSQQVGRRAVFNSTNMIGSWNRSFGAGFGFTTPLQDSDPAFDVDIDEEVFDTRIRFLSTSNSLSYSFSPRLSASANGGFFRTDRVRSLVSVRGANASGDLAYRLTRRQTISFSYGFNEFNFADRYGNTFIQTIGANYSLDMGNNWVMTLGARGFRLEIDGLQTVAVSPEIAAIIGRNTGLETFYRVNYFPGYVARLSKSFRKMSASVYGQSTIRPGNGIIRTSRFDQYGAFYSYTGIRKWNFGARVGRFERTNLVGFSGTFRTYLGGASVGYHLLPTLQLNAAAIYRDIRSTTPDRDFTRNGWRYTFGISFAPGDIPISLF
jgi:hypothetical protein